MSGARIPDVVVVGAGLSGLTAARELTNAGLDVRVLEARDRPGGRTWVTEADGVTVDLGGEWVDEAHTELRTLISELGIEIYPYERRKENARWYVGGELSREIPFFGQRRGDLQPLRRSPRGDRRERGPGDVLERRTV